MKKLLLALFLLLPFTAQAQICGSVPFTLQAGQTAVASQVMANFNAILNCVNANAATNGANSDITSLSGLTTPLSAAQGGTNNYYGSSVTGTANALSITTVVPNAFTLVAGKILTFISASSNTGPATMNAASTGATSIYRVTGSAGITTLGGGEIVSGGIYNLMYDGSRYLLLNPSITDDPGVLKDYAGSAVPTGWQAAYGQVVAQADYAGLYTAIGGGWNTGGEGGGNFRLPDFRGRVAAGFDSMGGSAANRLTSGGSGCTSTAQGQTCGDQLEQSHTHTYTRADSGSGLAPGGILVTQSGATVVSGFNQPFTVTINSSSQSTGSTGSGSSQNVQPTAMVFKIIRN